MTRRERLIRAFWPAATVVIAIAGVAELLWLWPYMADQQAIGSDYAFFMRITQTWVDTGVFYLPHQLAGPYEVQTLVDVLYPPIALYLFVPFLVLPAILWWLIPLGLFTWGIVRLRPAPWTWPLIMLAVAWPQTIAQILYGNTNMWIAAFIAMGVNFAWPSLLVLIKPSLAPFAIIGINRRSWWVGLAVLAVAAIPFGAMWLDYLTAMRNSSLYPAYALVTLPFMVAPLVAWLGRGTRRPRVHLESDPAAKAVPDVDDLAVPEVE
jgi:hypothetical protein